MPDMTGRFVWYELMTTDAKAARTFYTDVVGWRAEEVAMPGMTYTMFKAGDVNVAGLMAMTDDAKKMGAPPNWTGYVAVADVDKAAAEASKLGGSVLVPPTDIPNIGRFAVIFDPHKAPIAIFRGAGEMPESPFKPDTPGRVGWNELYSGDLDSAFGFYGKLFGWQKADAMDMGPMGTYQIFSAAGEVHGGMMTKPSFVPHPFWNYYFNVDGINAAAARVAKGGGKIANGPSEVPGGVWMVQGTDPQGATFALIGPKD